MQKDLSIAVLFDLDGVVYDTETQYSIFWGQQCTQYRPDIPNLHALIKGQTLDYIFRTYFPDSELQHTIQEALDQFEATMAYDYVPGAYQFIQDLKKHGAKLAVVTSSNQQKMAAVRQAHPNFDQLFDRVLTSEDFPASKPAPDCYWLGAKVFNMPLENCLVLEDSFNGLKAGVSSGIFTVALATTNPAEALKEHSHVVWNDFVGKGYQDVIQLLQARK